MNTMKNLTIIIPFLNEGDEIENTVISILETVVNNPEIILINDASNDGYNYKSIAYKYNCRYIEHETRMGVASSRDEGVNIAESPYFLLLDGHMRFYEKGWDARLVNLLEEYPRTLLCGQTHRLCKDEYGNVVDAIELGKQTSFGAYINKNNMQATWNKYDTSPHSNLMEIPCVLGAAYATSKAYWQYLHGLKGLKYYGVDEQLISIKVWREGGRCLLVKDWIVGHIYRDAFPYMNLMPERIYNLLCVAELILPYSSKKNIFSEFKDVFSNQLFENGIQQLKENYRSIKKEKEYLENIFKYDLERITKLNEKLIRLNNNKEGIVVSRFNN